MVVSRNRRAFTLIEELIIIAIISILLFAVIIRPSDMLSFVKARTWRAEMETLKKALMSYSASVGSGSYPTLSGIKELNEWLSSNGVSRYIDEKIVNPFHANATINMGATNDPQPLNDLPEGSNANLWIGYIVSDVTIGGETVPRGQFTIYYKINDTVYSLSNIGG